MFGAGSVVAALSTTVTHLITARVIQGVGGAMILPSTLSTVNATFQGKARAVAFGVWGAVMSGAAVGAAVSGAVLSASLVTTLPDALAKAGLPTQQLQGLIDAVRLIAGSALPGVRHDNPAVADALAEGFALASRNALLAAAAFLFIGLLAALKVRGCEGAKRGAGGRVGARIRPVDLGAL